MFACIGFIFLSLLELAVAAMYEKRIYFKNKNKHSRTPVKTGSESNDLNLIEMNGNSIGSYEKAVHNTLTNGDLNVSIADGLSEHSKPAKHIGALIDRASRVLFPVVFTIFNAFYWGYYMYKSNY